jgi:hypothetical protein
MHSKGTKLENNLNFQEYFRASNSAKLLMIAAPKYCELLLFGTKKAEEFMVEHFGSGNISPEDEKRTMILFPSQDSISVYYELII